jgi:hypothetical protein
LALRDAVAGGALPKKLDTHRLAAALVASVQGGYILSRAMNNPSIVNDATAGALALLKRIARNG